MDSRRHIPPAYEGRSVQASEVMRYGQLPAGYHLVGHASSEVLENKLALQAAEIDGLARDNKKLAASQVALRQDLVAAQLEIQKRKDDIRTIRTESDIQIRALLDSIAKIETDIRAGERIKRELKEAEIEARSLIAANHDLASHIQNASQELEKTRDDIKKLPEMIADLDSLRQEHQRLRKTFELEKGANVEKVKQMHIMETDLVDMANEIERLRDKVLNSEIQTHAPNLPNGLYVTQDPLHRPSLNGSMSYLDQNRRLHYNLGAEAAGERRVELGNSNSAIGPGTGSSSWGGAYETRHIGR